MKNQAFGALAPEPYTNPKPKPYTLKELLFARLLLMSRSLGLAVTWRPARLAPIRTTGLD